MLNDSSNSKRALPRFVLIGLILVGVVAGYLFASLAGALLAGLVYLVFGGEVAGTSQWLSGSTIGQFVYTFITYAVMVLFVAAVFSGLKISFKDIKLGRPHWKDPLWALAFAPLYYASYAIIVGTAIKLFPGFNAQQQQDIGFANAAGSELILVFISLVVIPPIIEEIITRGYLYSGLQMAAPKWLAALITSIIFAVAHLQFGSGGPLVWVAAVFTFVLSLYLLALREKTGRLWAGIFLHALVNGISFVFLFIYR